MKIILRDTHFDKLTVNKDKGEVFALRYSEGENTPGESVDIYELFYRFHKWEEKEVNKYEGKRDWFKGVELFYRTCLSVKQLIERIGFGVRCMLAIGNGEVGEYRMSEKEWWVFQVLEIVSVRCDDEMCEVNMKLRRL